MNSAAARTDGIVECIAQDCSHYESRQQRDDGELAHACDHMQGDAKIMTQSVEERMRKHMPAGRCCDT